MKFLTLLSILTLPAAPFLHADPPPTGWTTRALASLDNCNTHMRQAIAPLQPQAIFTYDRKFATLLALCRERLPLVPAEERTQFEQRLDFLAQAHIRALDAALAAMQRDIRARIEAGNRLESRDRHEDTLAELQAIEDALRGK